MRDEPAGRPIAVGRLRGVVALGAWPPHWIGPDVDPDRLLTSPRCDVIKFQRKIAVGRVETPIGMVYVKRYNVHAWRVAIGSLGRESPALRAYANTLALRARGFDTPEPLAALEYRRGGLVQRSFLLTRAVPDAVTADVAWAAAGALASGAAGRQARRALTVGLGGLFRDLHASGVAHGDLKDVNVLVRGPASSPTFVVLDLEVVRFTATVSPRQRLKNLVQLARTLGVRARGVDQLRFLRAYLEGDDRAARRQWAQRIRRVAARKSRGKAAVGFAPRPGVSCAIVCQNETRQIAACLESVRWCDEIVVVDGGSQDGTVAIARRYTPRVLHNPWPGYRAQKQFALEAATEPWVLSLDADERVSDELATEMRRALAGVDDGVDGFAAPRLVAYLGRWWFRGGWYPRPVLRLFRRGVAHWGGVDPHDRAVVPGRVVRLHAPIFHYTYADVQDHLRTVSRLTDVAAANVPAGRRVGLGRLVGEPVWRLLRSYVLKAGWREGLPGAFVAVTDAFYVFLRWARVWEREQHPGRRAGT